MRKLIVGMCAAAIPFMGFSAAHAEDQPQVCVDYVEQDDNCNAPSTTIECSTGVINELGGCEPVGTEACPQDGSPPPCEPETEVVIDGPATVALPAFNAEVCNPAFERCDHMRPENQPPSHIWDNAFPAPAQPSQAAATDSPTNYTLPETGLSTTGVAILMSLGFIFVVGGFGALMFSAHYRR